MIISLTDDKHIIEYIDYNSLIKISQCYNWSVYTTKLDWSLIFFKFTNCRIYVRRFSWPWPSKILLLSYNMKSLCESLVVFCCHVRLFWLSVAGPLHCCHETRGSKGILGYASVVVSWANRGNSRLPRDFFFFIEFLFIHSDLLTICRK